MDWRVYDYYFYAGTALVGTFAAAAVMLWALRRARWRSRVEGISGIGAPFINALGVLFALTLAFLANDTWNAHDRALAAVDREADALSSIVVLASHLPAEDASRVRKAAKAYAQAAEAEWPMLARRETSAAASGAANRLIATLGDPEIVAETGSSVSQAEISLALAVRDGRETRIALSQTHVNPFKWAGMAFLGFLTMASVALVHVGKPRAMTVAVAIFACGSAPTAVIVLIHGNPFQPPAAVSPAPFAEFAAQ